MATMRDDLVHALSDAGYADVEVEVALSPAWSSDWITEQRPRKLCATHGLSRARPGAARGGPIPLTLMPDAARGRPARSAARRRTELTSEFGATACKALYRCTDCLEPFEHVKEI